jgi:hypothetical protein
MATRLTDPLTSRARFRSRALVNIVGISAGFILVVVILSAVLSHFGFFAMLVGDAVALAFAAVSYVLFDKRAIQLECPNCHAIVSSNTPWVCGVCSAENRNPTEYPFVHRCSNFNCRNEPKAYRCHHETCGQLIFLTDDQDTKGFAYRLHSEANIPKVDPDLERRKERASRKEERVADIEMAELDERFRNIQARQKTARKKSPKAKLRADFGATMELEEAAEELKAEINEECKGDPARRKRRIAAVEMCLRRQIGE